MIMRMMIINFSSQHSCHFYQLFHQVVATPIVSLLSKYANTDAFALSFLVAMPKGSGFFMENDI